MYANSLLAVLNARGTMLPGLVRSDSLGGSPAMFSTVLDMPLGPSTSMVLPSPYLGPEVITYPISCHFYLTHI